MKLQTLALCISSSVLAITSVVGSPNEVIACGAESTGTFTPNCPTQCTYTTTGYSTSTNACRAAKQGLKDLMVFGTGCSCANGDCEPGFCHTAIACLDATCSALTLNGPPCGPAGPCTCTASWDGSDYKVACTECE
jgi:hypothetical protein